MSWLKKNLGLVAGGVVALGLLAFAVYFLLKNKQAVDEVTEQLNGQTQELTRLTSRDPFPNQENIEAARQEQKKLGGFVQTTRKFFVPAASFTNMDGASFKDLLQTTISELEHDAEQSGVHLPDQYDFTFAPQRKSVVFAPETLVPLASEVAEIKAICGVLFAARVHALTGLRRAPVAKDDDGATDYLAGKKPATNSVTGAVLAPYEITFQGFTAELASVLEGFYRSSSCFIVKNIDVQTNVVSAGEETQMPRYYLPYPGTTSVPSVGPRPSYDEQMRRRYGLGGAGSRYGSRYSPGPPVSPTPAPTISAGGYAPRPRRGPETVLDEHPFKVTMYVEAVRWPEPAKPEQAKRKAGM